MKKLKLFLTFIIFLSLIILINTETLPEMHFIASGTLNGTASFVSLEDMNDNEKYVYFTFDFNFHNISVNDEKAYFLFNKELNLKDIINCLKL